MTTTQSVSVKWALNGYYAYFAVDIFQETVSKGSPILALHYDKSIGGCQGAEIVLLPYGIRETLFEIVLISLGPKKIKI